MAEKMPPTQQELEARIIDRASKDEAFRRSLIEDPKGTLEREVAVKVPDMVSLTVIEESSTRRYIVLPPARKGDNRELSDQELELVAGGGGQYLTTGGARKN